MLGSLDEAQDVLAHRGVQLDTKTVRLIAYRYAARARLAQQIEATEFDESVAGRRVVMSSAGGRMRLREPKRGPKTPKPEFAVHRHLQTWNSCIDGVSFPKRLTIHRHMN